MEIIRKTNNNVSNVTLNNQKERKVIKTYDDVDPADVAAEMGEDPNAPQGVTFEKPAQENPFEPEQETEVQQTQTIEPEKTAADKRAERRAAFKEAANIQQRAMQMQKQAEAKLAKAQRFEELSKKAQEDPIEFIKSTGQDPQEFLRRFQNSMYNIPNEAPAPKPEEEVKQRLERYEAERQAERQKAAEIQSQMVRQNYISTKILPVLNADPDKFQILNQSNLEASANFMYDMMNQHFMATGEELNAADVAEEMENQLQQELETKLQQAAKLPKLSKYFKEQQAAAPSPQLGGPPPKNTVVSSPKTLSNAMESLPPLTNTQVSGKKTGGRNERLQKVLNKYGR